MGAHALLNSSFRRLMAPQRVSPAMPPARAEGMASAAVGPVGLNSTTADGSARVSAAAMRGRTSASHSLSEAFSASDAP
jgi:hypothetical protein